MTISPRESVISHTLSETAVSNSRLVSPRNFPWYLHDRILLESVSLWMALFWLACEPCRLLLLLLLCEILRNARPYIKTKAILKHKTYMLTFIAKSHTFTHACVYQLSLRWIYKQTTPTRVARQHGAMSTALPLDQAAMTTAHVAYNRSHMALRSNTVVQQHMHK